MTVFTTEFTVQFRHCDVAGIVFYPRYVEMISDTIETWFAGGLDCNFHDLHLVRHLGVPTVRMEVDYKNPSYLGDVVSFDLTLTEIRTRSFSTRIHAHVAGETRLEARSTLVFVNSGNAFLGEGKMKPTTIPDDLKARMETFLEQPAPDC